MLVGVREIDVGHTFHEKAKGIEEHVEGMHRRVTAGFEHLVIPNPTISKDTKRSMQACGRSTGVLEHVDPNWATTNPNICKKMADH